MTPFYMLLFPMFSRTLQDSSFIWIVFSMHTLSPVMDVYPLNLTLLSATMIFKHHCYHVGSAPSTMVYYPLAPTIHCMVTHRGASPNEQSSIIDQQPNTTHLWPSKWLKAVIQLWHSSLYWTMFSLATELLCNLLGTIRTVASLQKGSVTL